MPTPTTTASYNSIVDLHLGNVPDLEEPELYSALLAIHNAIQILATLSVGTSEDSAASYIAKQRAVVLTNTNYLVTSLNGTILVAANTSDVLITLPPAVDNFGYQYTIKCIDATFAVTVVGEGVSTIDSYAAGIGLTLHDALTVRCDGSNWWII
jgi:hypothetical protein